MVIDSHIWIPTKYVNKRLLKKLFEFSFLDEAQNEYFEEDEEELVILHRKKKIGGVKCTGFPIGRMDLIKQVVSNKFNWKKLKDNRVCPKIPKKFKFEMVIPAYDYQKESGDRLRKAIHGILKAPPRSGKTVTTVNLVCDLQVKTLIIAHQDDLLKQFYKEFTTFTNIEDVEKFHGTKLIGKCTEVFEFKKYQVCLCTYQTFLSASGRKKLEKIKDMFGMIVIDEYHRTSADGYLGIISEFQSLYRFGLTATPDRKDGRFVLSDVTIGPIVHEVNVEMLKPKVRVHLTNITPEKNYVQWVAAMRFLEKSEERNDLILDYVYRDLKRGHNIIIPVLYKSHSESLVEWINDELGPNTAVPFNGSLTKAKRDDALDGAREGRYRVVVAMQSMLTGVNVPRWSAYYSIFPVSNPPLYEQLVNRVCTPMEGKKNPLIRIFVDDMGPSYGCFRTCCKTFFQFSYPWVGPISKRIANTILNGKKVVEPDGDEFTKHRRNTKNSDAAGLFKF